MFIVFYAGVHEYPFLYARMFSAVAKFSTVVTIAIFPPIIVISPKEKLFFDFVFIVQINNGVVEQFLYAAIKAIGMDV